MAIESKNVFFILASFLIFIIILSMLGILAPNDYSKEVVVNTNREMYYPPVYYGGPYRKNNVYAPNVFMGRGPYIRRYY